MLTSLLPALTLLAVLGCGLIAGVFFTFSTFVMRSLEVLPQGRGAAAMRSINKVILTSPFIPVFLGSAGLCAALGIVAVYRWGEPGAAWLLAASAFYFGGSFLVTVLFNVPLNNNLEATDPEGEEGILVWQHYLRYWTYWNHVRTIASLAAAAGFVIALLKM